MIMAPLSVHNQTCFRRGYLYQPKLLNQTIASLTFHIKNQFKKKNHIYLIENGVKKINYNDAVIIHIFNLLETKT